MGRRIITPGDGDPAHGTPSGYSNNGCRGTCCTTAHAAYRADPERRQNATLNQQHHRRRLARQGLTTRGTPRKRPR